MLLAFNAVCLDRAHIKWVSNEPIFELSVPNKLPSVLETLGLCGTMGECIASMGFGLSFVLCGVLGKGPRLFEGECGNVMGRSENLCLCCLG